MNIIAYSQQNRYVRLDKYTDLLTLIQSLDCHFIAVKFICLKKMVLSMKIWVNIKKRGILFRYISDIPKCM